MENKLNRLNKLKNQENKIIHLDGDVEKIFLNQEKFPLVIKSTLENFSLKNWISENKNKFEQDLLKYGAILFRDFKIETVEKFQDLMLEFPKKPLEYKFRSSPRFELSNNVYVSTTYPEDLTINMHSENSYAPDHPDRIVFCCITPAEMGGETPIADNRLVLSHISNELKQKFLEYGVQYRRNLNGILGLSWQEVFQTTDRNEVETECSNNNIQWEWIDETNLVIKWNKKAIWEHPMTRELVWFNHALFFNKYMFDEELLKYINSDNELPSNTFFGNGEEISKEEIEEIKVAYKKATVEFSWKKGDVIFLDNLLFSHGRNPYKGERKIIVSIL